MINNNKYSPFIDAASTVKILLYEEYNFFVCDLAVLPVFLGSIIPRRLPEKFIVRGSA